MSGGKSQEVVVGYKYYLGAHLVPTLGPIDEVVRLQVADRTVSFRGPSEVMLTIDASSSMSSSDPDDLRIDAGKRFVDAMTSNVRAGVVKFTNGGTLLQGLTTDRQALHDALDLLDANGSTSLTAGVSTSLTHLDGNARSGAGRFIILLTDGVGDWDETLEDDAVASGTVIYTVGLGGDVNDALLQQIATNTGGAYYKADTPEDIDPIFQQILVLVTAIASSGMHQSLVAGTAFTPPDWSRVYAASPGLFGGESREGGISGNIDIGFGFPEQTRNDYLEAHLGADVPAYRGLVSFVLRQVYVGLNPYLKAWKIRLRRIYTRAFGEPQWYWQKAGWPEGHHAHGDMNPIHAIREALTEPWGARLPESEIGPTYAAVADQIYDEGLGVSLLWTDDTSPKALVDELIRHIDAIRYEDPETGLQEIALIRGGYDPETLPVLDPSNCSVTKRSTVQVSETTNQITVIYDDWVSGKNTPLTVQDTAAITMSGRIRSATLEYPGFSHAETALQAAERDLTQMARPFDRFEITATRLAPRLRPGDLFVLNSPDDGIAGMVCRVARRRPHGLVDGSVDLEAAEDVFGTVWSTYTVPPESGWVDPVGAPRNLEAATAMEAPYYLLVTALGEEDAAALPLDAGYYAYAGQRPSLGTHLNYGLYAAAEGETLFPEDVISADFTPVAIVDGDIDDPSQTLIPVTQLPDLDLLRAGQLVLIGDALDAMREIAELEVVPEDGATTVQLLRGVIDSVPRPIADGTRLWFIEAMVGISRTEYTEGEIVTGHGRPRNGQGEFEAPLDGSDPYLERDIQMAARQYRPYPAANVQLDGLYPHQLVPLTSSTATLTWAYRDRVTQSDHPLTWYDPGDVGPEAGTTYRVEAHGLDAAGVPIAPSPFLAEDLGLVNSYVLDLDTNPEPAGSVRILVQLWAVRDGYDSLQSVDLTIPLTQPPADLTAEYVPVFAPTDVTLEEI